MLRLELMPLIPDFGESLQHPMKQVNPYTHLKLTRDYRIFAQFSNFPDTFEEKSGTIIHTSALPEGFTIASASEEDGVVFTREDESGEISWVYARELKTLVIPENTSPVNKAIKAYIDQLPDETQVLLKWD
jgi:hypothetical protein